MKQLLSLVIYKFTGDDIGKLKANGHNRDWVYNHMPRYCLKDDGTIGVTPHWLQFVEEGRQKYWLFDIVYSDNPLSREIVDAGIEEIFGNTDMRPLFEYFKGEFNNGFVKPKIIVHETDYECYGKSDPTPHHVIVELEYIGSGEDSDMNCSIWGYLDGNMEPHKYLDLCSQYFILNNDLSAPHVRKPAKIN